MKNEERIYRRRSVFLWICCTNEFISLAVLNVLETLQRDKDSSTKRISSTSAQISSDSSELQTITASNKLLVMKNELDNRNGLTQRTNDWRCEWRSDCLFPAKRCHQFLFVLIIRMILVAVHDIFLHDYIVSWLFSAVKRWIRIRTFNGRWLFSNSQCDRKTSVSATP